MILAIIFELCALYCFYLAWQFLKLTDEEYKRCRKAKNPALEMQIILANKEVK